MPYVEIFSGYEIWVRTLQQQQHSLKIVNSKQARVQGGPKGPAPPPLEIEKQKKRLSDFGPLPLRIPGHAPVKSINLKVLSILIIYNVQKLSD